jgi:hydroxyquinol 1,2-dioxygenase
MQNLNEHNITDEVVRRLQQVPSPRLQEIMTSLIKHLHEFAREVHLSEDE